MIFKFDSKNFKGKVNSQINIIDSSIRPWHLLLSFSLFLVCGGILVGLFPKFFAVLFGSFLVFLGVASSIIAYKIYKFKKKFDGFVNNMQKNSIVVHQINNQAFEESVLQEDVYDDEGTVVEVINKKIILH